MNVDTNTTFVRTDEIRRPRRGEFFVNLAGEVERASRDYYMTRFPIVVRIDSENGTAVPAVREA